MSRSLSLLSDLLRLPVALVKWNWAKSNFRIRGARGRCPCQHPSDSGHAGETGCEACLDWAASGRFRWVCPLLVWGEHGWHCSVSAAEVRPFWGRAASIFGGALLSLYGLLTAAVYGVLLISGVEGLSWVDVVWPPNWGEVTHARARYFTVRAGRLMAESDFPAAELSVLTALQLHPEDYEAALFLAHLRQYQRNYAHSDSLFRRLLDEHPARSAETALAWHDVLLLRQRYPELASLSLHMVAVRPELSSIWVRSALFALRLMPEVSAYLERAAGEVAALPAPGRALIAAEELHRRGESRAAARLLEEYRGAALEPSMVGEFVEQLLRLGDRTLAEEFLRVRAAALLPFDRQLLQLRIDAAAGDAALVRMGFQNLLRAPLTHATVSLALGWLIEHPDRRSFERLEAEVRRSADPGLMVGLEMWLAALICEAPNEMPYWASYSRQRFGLRAPLIKAVEFKSDDMMNPASPTRLIAIGRLPHEVVLSLLRRTASVRATTTTSQNRR